MPGRITLEIVCTSLETALIAQQQGADRIEFCVNLEVGGTTPSRKDIQTVKQSIHIPMHVMVSPRGKPYIYNSTELGDMIDDILFCKSTGIDGVVIGCLNLSNEIDTEHLSLLVEAAYPMSVTFHRAFDECKPMLTALDVLISHGVKRVLTTGGAITAFEGMQMLQALTIHSHQEIIILPGGGVRHTNAEAILEHTGATEIHSAANILNGLDAFKAEVAALKEAVTQAGNTLKLV